MRQVALITAVALFSFACAAHSQSLREALTLNGVDLGRLERAALPAQIELLAPAEGDGVVQGFMVARFQNNQPLMKSADGSWQPWDGDAAALQFVNIAGLDGVLRFPVGDWPTEDALAPCTFTIGYQSADGLKFGYYTVDGL